MEGVKYDEGKDPWHLAPWDAFKAIIIILASGAEKYGARNWEDGMDWHRLYGATIRHMVSWWNREGSDPETGRSHLWHAGCCVLFLITYEIRGIGNDDRPRVEQRRPTSMQEWRKIYGHYLQPYVSIPENSDNSPWWTLDPND
jgi:hypothetical protein